jgi:hypothetical protein
MKRKQLLNQPQSSSVLYFGTTEVIAKEAVHKGIPPISILTNAYPGYFAAAEAAKYRHRWGIVEVNIESLMPDSLVPSTAYIEKITRRKKSISEKEIVDRREKLLKMIGGYREQWRDSLDKTGVCMYILQIPTHAITKVTIYTAHGRDSNQYINQQIASVNPFSQEEKQHEENVKKHIALTKWLACEPFELQDLSNTKLEGLEIDLLREKIYNRAGLDMFFMKTEKDSNAWWRA